MSRRCVRGVILCEDRRQGNLVRRYLLKAGLAKDRRQIRERSSRSGDASKFVRVEYPKEIKALRSKPHQSDRLLITMIDADKHTVKERCTQLDRELKQKKLAPRSSEDRVFVLVPKRNVDTWIWFLNDNDVNETDDYKSSVKPEHCSHAPEELCELRKSGWVFRDGTPPSLIAGCAELRNIENPP